MKKIELKDLETRVCRLEDAVFGNTPAKLAITSKQEKRKTFPEIVRGKKFKNGQQKVAAIVGYLEKIEHKAEIRITDIRSYWFSAKLDGLFNDNLLRRAIKVDALVRESPSGTFDLTQTGEEFFTRFLKE